MSNDAEAALLDRDSAHLIHPLHSQAVHSTGKVWVGGEGAFLIDANGDRYIDGLSGLWNNTAGNGRRELIEAGSKQLAELAYASGYAGSSNPRAIELGEKLALLLLGGQRIPPPRVDDVLVPAAMLGDSPALVAVEAEKLTGDRVEVGELLRVPPPEIRHDRLRLLESPPGQILIVVGDGEEIKSRNVNRVAVRIG